MFLVLDEACWKYLHSIQIIPKYKLEKNCIQNEAIHVDVEITGMTFTWIIEQACLVCTTDKKL